MAVLNGLNVYDVVAVFCIRCPVGLQLINKAEILRLKRLGLDLLIHSWTQENKSPFQEALLQSLFLYSKSSLAKNVADKLIYILVALESMLLRDDKEWIQQSIAERMAFLIGANRDHRKSIAQNVKEAYNLRSRFLHHGRSIEDLSTLETFMQNAWMFFHCLLQKVNQIQTKEQLIATLEDRKYE